MPSRPFNERSAAGGTTESIELTRSWICQSLLGLFVLAYLLWFAVRPVPDMGWLIPDGPPPSRLTLLIGYANWSILWELWTSAGQATLLDRLPYACATVAQLALAGVAGWLLTERWVTRIGLSLVGRLAIYLAIGLQCISLTTLALGLAGLLRHHALFATIAITVYGIGIVQGTRHRLWQRCHPQLILRSLAGSSPNSAGTKLLVGCSIGFALVVMLLAVLPPTDFDVREYHLQVPKEWYQSGRISFLPHNIYGNMPLGAELQATWSMSCWPWQSDRWWHGALAGKCVMATYLLIAAVAVAVAAGESLGTSSDSHHAVAGGWAFAPLILLSTPWTLRIAANGLNENALGLYLFTSIWMATRTPQFRDSTQSRPNVPNCWHAQVIVSGILLGAAISIKYTAFLFAAPLPLYIFYRSRYERLLWRGCGLFVVATCISGGPWLVKNAAMTGNPVYPLFVSHFGPDWRQGALDEQWQSAHQVPRDASGRRFSPSQAISALLSVAGESTGQHGLAIALALLATMTYRCGTAATRHAIIVATGATIWGFVSWWGTTHRLERFWVPLVPWLALLATYGAAWTDRSTWRRTLVLAAISVGVCHGVLSLSPPLLADIRWLTPLTKLRDDHLRVDCIHRYLNEQVGSDEAVLLVGDAQPFDLQVRCYYNTCFDVSLLEDWLGDRPVAQQRAELERRQIGWIYYDRREVERYRSPGNYGYTDYVDDARFAEWVEAGLLEVVSSDTNGTLYRVP